MKQLRLAAVLALACATGPIFCVQAMAQQPVEYTGNVTLDTGVVTKGKRPVTDLDGLPIRCMSGCSGSTTTVATTDKAGTITSGGTAQTAIASNSSRKGWCIQNAPTASEVMTVRVNGTASATTGTALQPGQQVCNQPGLVDTAAISVFAATTSHAWLGFEVQ